MEMKLQSAVWDGAKLVHTITPLKPVPDSGQEERVINLYPETEYQSFEGFGGAVTDAAGYVYSLMGDEEKRNMVQRYFGAGGAGYTMVRVPIDSCDFSLEHYEAMSAPDEDFASFSMARNGKYIFPLLDAIQAELGRPVPVMLTPWSPPPFMKTNGERNNGGKLKTEYYGLWARYICRFIKEMQARGYHVHRLSVQNEPKAVQTWDSCIFTAEEEKAFLRDALYPALLDAGIQDIEVFIWDHNKERLFDRALVIIDNDTGAMISGLALHWYSGDHFDALRLVRERFPDKKLILSEACIEFCKYAGAPPLQNAVMYAHDLIGNLNNGLNAFYDWNLVLDEQGGPNHVGNYCEAPFMFDTHKGRLTEKPSLAYIEHFSRSIKPGAKRVAHTCYTPALECTAWRNTDGGLRLIILNSGREDHEVCLRIAGMQAALAVPAESISTLEISL